MSLLDQARSFAPELNILVNDSITDQYGWRLAWDSELENGKPATLLALSIEFKEEVGMAKSIDYWLINNARESTRHILLYVYDKVDASETIYKADPAEIIKAANISFETSAFSLPPDETICPICHVKMERGHSHPASDFSGPRLEVHNHRLKYWYIPFNQLYLENLNRSAANPIEDHEQYLLDELLNNNLKVRYVGNQPGERKLFGFCPDYALYSHEGIGCRLLELGPKSAKEKRERRGKAEELGCHIKFLDYTPKEVRQKTDEIVEEVVGWVNQSDLKRFGVADD